MTDPLVSIVSLSCNRRANVAELLAALRCQTYHSFEIIVVDNDSQDGTTDLIREQFPEVQLIEVGANPNMVAYNLGFEVVQGEYTLVMDDDGLPASDDWIAQVVSRFERNPRLGAVCCTIRMRDTGKIAHDSPQFVPQGDPLEGYPGVAFNGTGAGLRTAALKQVGFYPWHFGIVYLELHLCTRLIESGWEVQHFPDIEVWHCRPSGSSLRTADYWGLRNYYWYVWQFYPWPHVLLETLHELARCGKLTMKGRSSAGRSWKATRDAFLGAGPALAQRQPISLETLKYMRWVRRHGNWHSLIPETASSKDACRASAK